MKNKCEGKVIEYNKFIFKSKIIFIIFMFLIINISTANIKIIYADNEQKLSEQEYSEEYIEWMNMSDEEKEKTTEPYKYEIKNSDTFITKTRTAFNIILGTQLESKFDLRNVNGKSYVTDVKNQGETSLCWAYATLGALESNLLINDYERLDLSETHMDYGTSAISTTNNTRGFNRSVKQSGNYFLAQAYLTNGLGAVKEEDMPDSQNNTTRSIYELKNIEKITKVEDTIYFGEYDESTILKVKNHLKEHGAVFANIKGEGIENSKYYNKSTNALYYNGSGLADHGVVIIGWDDEYLRTNFNSNNMPNSNGAWIAKNSWGELYGDNGYIYISYEDTKVNDNMFGFINTSTNIDYDRIYQHDELGISRNIGNANSDKLYLANVFENTRKNEVLTEVSVNIDGQYNCTLYVNSEDESLDTNKLRQVQTYSNLEPGYHTLKLNTPIVLTGDKFVVAIKYEKKEGTNTQGIYIPVEMYSENGFWSTVKVNKNESYATTDLSKEWTDLSEYQANATIKAFTTINYNIDQENLYITGIDPETMYGDFLNKISETCEINNVDKQDNDIVKTGDKITVINQDNTETTYTLIVSGDVNKDGQTDIKDIFAINRYRRGKGTLENECIKAGDVNEDGNTDIKDMFKINRYRRGKMEHI
ncbi:MAG: hypothetical protein IKF52_00885 [Clostridia bacterium]|nr:hypothetical protein [Clostridia bacterium]